MLEVQQISRFYLKKKVIGSFSSNPVQDTEIEKLLIKLPQESFGPCNI